MKFEETKSVILKRDNDKIITFDVYEYENNEDHGRGDHLKTFDDLEKAMEFAKIQSSKKDYTQEITIEVNY